MSADNWAVCPRCKILADDELARKTDEIRSQYGKIPIDDFVKLQAAAIGIKRMEKSLREDYEIGVGSDGNLHISYGCVCAKCNFAFDYSNTIDLIEEARRWKP